MVVTKKKLCDLNFIYKVLNELPDLIGMRKISSPYVIFHKPNKKSFDKGGISGFILIAESHISIHTFIGYSFVSIDIFSCKKFNIKKAENYLIKVFEAEKIEKNFFNRGKSFKRNILKI